MRRRERILVSQLTQAPTGAPIDQRPLFTPDGRVHLDAMSARMADADERRRSYALSGIAGLAKADALNTRERLSWPRVVIEEQPLTGAFIVFKDMGDNVWRLAWDPAQTTRDKVEIAINIYVAGSGEYHEISSDTYRDLQALAKLRRPDDDPAVTAWWDLIDDLILTSNDSQGVLRDSVNVMRLERAARAADAAKTEVTA